VSTFWSIAATAPSPNTGCEMRSPTAYSLTEAGTGETSAFGFVVFGGGVLARSAREVSRFVFVIAKMWGWMWPFSMRRHR
jgi:hypothetical protein